MNSKQRTILLIGIATCSLITVGILYGLSIRQSDNGFIRQFPPHIARQLTSYDLGYNSYYIAGNTTESLYLGNSTAPLHLLRIDRQLTDTQHIVLTLENGPRRFGIARVALDSPYFYLMDGAVPVLMQGNINDWIAKPLADRYPSFIAAAPIGPTSFAIRNRELNPRPEEYLLAKASFRPQAVKLAPTLLEKQIDGKFCTDGMMHYNKQLNQFIYLYYYRNEFLVTDSTLNLLHRGHTIDTVSQAKIAVGSYINNNSETVTMAAPPQTVNKHSSTWGKWLFVHSALRATNENKETFWHSSVIDVYDLVENRYLFSFHLPRFNAQEMDSFHITGNLLVALYGRHVVTYRLNKIYFDG